MSMAKTEQEESYAESKAKARHEKIAKEKKDSVDSVKMEAEHKRRIAIRREEKRKEEIKELPRSERSAAKAELKEEIRKRKQAEKEAKRIEKEKLIESKKSSKIATGSKKSDENAPALVDAPLEQKSDITDEPVATSSEITDEMKTESDSSENEKESLKQRFARKDQEKLVQLANRKE